MAKKELTAREKKTQLETWQNQVKGLSRFVGSTPELEAYQEEDWVWVKGDTKPHKEELKFYGLRFCGRKESPHYQHWYLAAPKWYTAERRAREAELAAAAAEVSLKEALEKLVGRIEEMELDCDAEVYEELWKLIA